jgi:hypothetical protein
VQDAETKATASTALLVSGGLVATTGVVLAVLGVVLEAPRAGVALSPRVSPAFVGLAIEGRL